MKPTDRRIFRLSDPGLPVRLRRHRHAAYRRDDAVPDSLDICLLRLGGTPIASAAIALILVEVNLVLFSLAIKKSLVGSEWGADHSTTFWSWRHFAYFFAQDCFSVWCRSLPRSWRRNDLGESHPTVDGMSYRPRDNRGPANAVLRLERGELRQ